MFEVKDVAEGSAAKNHGIKKGDKIASINGQQLIDYIDYVYFSAQERLKIKLFRDGRLLSFRIKKGEYEDLGLDFVQPLMGAKRVCANKCMFCFVDQLPKGHAKESLSERRGLALFAHNGQLRHYVVYRQERACKDNQTACIAVVYICAHGG